MKKIASLAAMLMVISVGAAYAGTNLAWTDCLGQGGTEVKNTQNCTNSAIVSNLLYVSFVAPQNIPQLGASDGVVDVVTPNPLGSWWLGGATRWGGTSGASTCLGWFDGAPSGNVPFGPGFTQIGPNRLRIRMVVSVPTGEEQSIGGTTEEFLAHQLQLKFNAGTFGNAECLGGAAFSVPRLELQQPGGAPSTIMESPEVTNCAIWRAPALVCPDATPTRKATWGSIKALYR